jgi:threonine synthase
VQEEPALPTADDPADRPAAAGAAVTDLEPGAEAPPEPVSPLLDASPGRAPALPDALSLDAWAAAAAADPALPLDERLDWLEDAFESEVGDTALTRARHLERETGLRQLFLKFEGGNPTGTQKDRIAFAQAADCLRRGFDTLTVATCGNYGAAVALAARFAGLEALIFIPTSYRTRRTSEMEALGAAIERVSGDYEAAVAASQERALRDELYDANPGGVNTPVQLKAYGEIAYEIYDDLRDAPAAVAVPVSNGTTLAGIYRGFVSLYRRGKTSRVPKLVAGSSWNKNPIVRSFRRGFPQCEDLDPAAIRETEVNEPLINWRALDGDEALYAVRESGGWAAGASDRAMRTMARRLREREGLAALPASTAGLIALLDRHAAEPLPGDRYVAVLTGRRG